jgi:hypothetical protein
MKNIKVEVTLQELLLLTTLMSDQLFRREFIDPKMPGYKRDPAELAMGKDLVLRLKAVIKQVSEPQGGPKARQAAGHIFPNPNGIPDAV